MKHRLILIFLFNVIDIIATLITTANGFIETNPIMALLLLNPALCVIIKLLLGGLVVWRLWQNRNNKYANIASWVIFIIYALVVLYYITIFILLI